MFFLGFDHSVRNMASVATAELGRPPNAENLRQEYFAVLNSHQGIELSVGQGIEVHFEDSVIASQRAFQEMLVAEGGERLAELAPDAHSLVRRNIDHALLILSSACPEYRALVGLHVADVVCSRVSGSGGGTASNLLGMIWLSPHPLWTAVDYAECLLHESVHLNLFLGDMVHGLYLDPREVRLNPEARAVSAIRGERRPLDKTLHAAAVAATLSEFYSALGAREVAFSFLSPLRDSVRDMANASRFFSPHGLAVLESVSEWVDRAICQRSTESRSIDRAGQVASALA